MNPFNLEMRSMLDLEVAGVFETVLSFGVSELLEKWRKNSSGSSISVPNP